MSSTILIVEDDIDLRDCLADCLRQQGYRVEIAVSGTDAIHKLQGGMIVDLVISDYAMRDGNGLELLKFIRRANPDKPAFFMITGHAQVTAEQVRILGAQKFILKPFDIPRLLAAIALSLAP
jgi:DNA-binding NtrC family response regulator